MRKTWQELYDEASKLHIRRIEVLADAMLLEKLRSITPSNGNKSPKSQDQRKLDNEQRELQVKIGDIKELFYKKLKNPDLSNMRNGNFLNFILVNYSFVDNKLTQRFKKIIPIEKITPEIIRRIGEKSDRERKRSNKTKYSFNAAAMTISAKRAAGWKPKNVVTNGSAYRKSGSVISR